MSLVSALALIVAVDTVPPKRADDAWLAPDQLQHASMSYAVTAFSFSVTSSESAAVASAALTGILKEIYDVRKGRKFSAKDLIWDAAGIAIGYAIIKQAR